MSKFVQRQYSAFQALAFATKPRKQWPLWIKLYWYYLVVFVWLHQGIVYKNWS
jgi:hypothetical protein